MSLAVTFRLAQFSFVRYPLTLHQVTEEEQLCMKSLISTIISSPSSSSFFFTCTLYIYSLHCPRSHPLPYPSGCISSSPLTSSPVTHSLARRRDGVQRSMFLILPVTSLLFHFLACRTALTRLYPLTHHFLTSPQLSRTQGRPASTPQPAGYLRTT
ncbi:hypothetical protein E2C01_087376 [Portunus trituberculatus]|uniref:Uncharacterized protein n=1 Tax=Portunus trituberculatus TaxID=210409 RepID=A0A5B7JDV7_PORTR|nr:hypothetical protein [Portunus trituberculatus]